MLLITLALCLINAWWICGEKTFSWRLPAKGWKFFAAQAALVLVYWGVVFFDSLMAVTVVRVCTAVLAIGLFDAVYLLFKSLRCGCFARWGWVAAIVMSLLVAIGAEVFVCNFAFFQTYGNTPQRLTNTSSVQEGPLGSGTVNFAYSLDSTPVDSLFLDFASNFETPITVSLRVADEGRTAGYDLGTRTLMPGLPRTFHLRLFPGGGVQNITVSVAAERAPDVAMNGAWINAPIPMAISWGRLVAIFVICLLGWLLRPDSGIYRVKLPITSWKQVVVLAVVAVTLGTFCLGVLAEKQRRSHSDMNTEHSKQYQKLARVLVDGQVFLNELPTQELLDLENPYDSSARAAIGRDKYPWDTAFFEGKFYVYFGAAPVVLTYLPYYMLVGEDLSNSKAIALFSLLFVLGVLYAVYQMLRRFFPETPFATYLLLCIGVLACSGFTVLINRPAIYEVPLIASLAFLTWGFGCLFRAMKTPRLAVAPLVLSGLSFALVAGCRPQDCLIALVSLPLLWSHIRGLWSSDRKRLVTTAAAFIAPVALVAIAVCWYNAARFGSPFDFGANYNLTTNDMTRRGIVMARNPYSIFHYFLQPPSMVARYPFLQAANLGTSYNGVFIAEQTYGGLLWFPFLWLLAFWRKAAAELRKAKLAVVVPMLLIVGVIIALLDGQVAGTLLRYFCDFSLCFGFAACLVYCAAARSDARRARTLRGLLPAAVLVSIIFALLTMQANWATDALHHFGALVQWWL